MLLVTSKKYENRFNYVYCNDLQNIVIGNEENE